MCETFARNFEQLANLIVDSYYLSDFLSLLGLKSHREICHYILIDAYIKNLTQNCYCYTEN